MNNAFGVSMIENSESADALGRPEARGSPRRRIFIDAQIAIGPKRSFSVQVQSISASGVFARRPDVTLNIGAAVEFVLPYRRRGQSSELRIPATVVRLEQDGVALRFGRYDSVVYTDLIDLIY